LSTLRSTGFSATSCPRPGARASQLTSIARELAPTLDGRRAERAHCADRMNLNWVMPAEGEPSATSQLDRPRPTSSAKSRRTGSTRSPTVSVTGPTERPAYVVPRELAFLWAGAFVNYASLLTASLLTTYYG